MSSSTASRLVLVPDGRPTPRPPADRVRRYRLARVRVAALRAPRPAHAHLGRMHD